MDQLKVLTCGDIGHLTDPLGALVRVGAIEISLSEQKLTQMVQILKLGANFDVVVIRQAEAAKNLEALSQAAGGRVVFVTEPNSSGGEQVAKDAGVKGVLTAPYGPGDLLRVMSTVARGESIELNPIAEAMSPESGSPQGQSAADLGAIQNLQVAVDAARTAVDEMLVEPLEWERHVLGALKSELEAVADDIGTILESDGRSIPETLAGSIRSFNFHAEHLKEVPGWVGVAKLLNDIYLAAGGQIPGL